MAVTPEILLFHAWLFALGLMAFLWAVQAAAEDAGVVDVGWCAGIGAITLYFALVIEGWWPRQLVVAVIVFIWSVRLSWFLLHERVLKGTEDFRHRKIRDKWGSKANLVLLPIFFLNSLLIPLFTIPPLVLLSNTRPEFAASETFGLIVCIFAVIGEAIADHQLSRFRNNPENKGHTCAEGLWRYSRHPNYFFEFLFWVGLATMAIGAPAWWWALLGPFSILVPIFFISGIPATERRALESRGEEYRRYQANTSAFMLWFPRNTS